MVGLCGEGFWGWWSRVIVGKGAGVGVQHSGYGDGVF